jgi:hypothetical protein
MVGSELKFHVLQTITRIYRIPGSQPVYRVVLSCDHRRTVTCIQIDQEQLFVGKTVECIECGAAKDNPIS